jgi:hypothetical protein
MGYSTPSLLPMLRLWAIVLFCLLTYLHACATGGSDRAQKAVRSLRMVTRHSLHAFGLHLMGSLVEESLETLARTKLSMIQGQAQPAAA